MAGGDALSAPQCGRAIMGERRKGRQTTRSQPARALLNYACRMNLPSLAPLLREILHPPVRDLAWTLLSPPLLCNAPAPQRHPLTASRWAEQPEELADWLRLLDSKPEMLDEWLQQRRSHRLGLYYERLWQFALGQAPDVELLRANLPIREERQTLGELDLLLRDAEGVHHLELAVKFYLGLDHGERSRHDHWLGPGSHDRLAIKLQRTCEHQLQLCQTPCARGILSELTGDAIHSAFWLAGYLFQPWRLKPAAPAGANPEHLRGRWLRRRDWPDFLRQYPPHTRWQPLPRPSWLAPARLQGTDLWQTADFDAWLDAPANHLRPWLLVRLETDDGTYWSERERVFLLPDSWPESAR